MLEIFLKLSRLGFIPKPEGNLYFPGYIFCSEPASARVVLLEPALEVVRTADISFLRMGSATKQVDVQAIFHAKSAP